MGQAPDTTVADNQQQGLANFEKQRADDQNPSAPAATHAGIDGAKYEQTKEKLVESYQSQANKHDSQPAPDDKRVAGGNYDVVKDGGIKNKNGVPLNGTFNGASAGAAAPAKAPPSPPANKPVPAAPVAPGH